MKKVIIMKDYRGFVRQQISVGSSLDLEAVKRKLNANGYETEEYDVSEVINNQLFKQIKDCYIWYCSSQNQEYKSYIDDALYYLSLNNTLIPRYEIFRAHDNKGFQELLRAQIGLDELSCLYLASEQELEKYADRIHYPVVVKKVNGAASMGVFLARSKAEISRLIKKMNQAKFQDRILYQAKKLAKKYLFRQKYDEGFYQDSTLLGRYILQEFVPQLSEDWKLNVFGDKYYVLNRKVRPNDFRASGSGLFKGLDPPPGLLEYAEQIFKKIDLPFASFDICFDGKRYILLEYQGTHFGPCPLWYTDHYYARQGDEWVKTTAPSNLSEEYANSLVLYLKKKDQS